MKEYIELYDQLKESIGEYFENNINTCDEKVAFACLYFIQMEFSDVEKWKIGSELNMFFKDEISDIIRKDFSNIDILEKFVSYIKYEILER